MRTKKGGASDPINWIAGLIIGGVFIVLILFQLQDQSRSTSKIMGRYIESFDSDFDGDGITDFYDGSPCVAGEDLIVASDGKQYFFFGDAADGDTVCKTENYGTYFPDLVSSGIKLEYKTEESTKLGVCIITERTCSIQLESHYKALRAS